MARMSIDDSFGRDPRVRLLAKLCGWSRRETMGALLDVWSVCYDRATPTLRRTEIDIAAELDGFANKLVEADLGTIVRGGRGGGSHSVVRVSGAASRIEYLNRAKASGATGGIKSGGVRRRSNEPFKGLLATPLGSTNPSVTANTSASASASASDTERERERAGAIAPVVAARPRSRKPRLSDATVEERAAAAAILERLTARNGVSYSSDAHLTLAVARLREGISAIDLRKVVAYCADETGLGWEAKDEMRGYLRPATLFGPQTIHKYLDDARAWFAKHYPQHDNQIGATQ